MNLAKHARTLSTTTLVLMMVSAIDSIRNLPATALFGSSLIFFFIFSAIVFLIPVALVSAELSAAHGEKNGIYHWATLAFGDKIGLLAVWLQWINTMVWFPTLLSFLAGTATYFLDPDLAQNKIYLVSMILAIFWGMTLLNLKGLQVSAKFSSLCTLFGTLIPLFVIIFLAGMWVWLDQPLQIHFSLDTIFPSLSQSNNWLSLTAIMASFLGMELMTVHAKDIAQPQKTFPKALGISVLLILVTMILGSLAVALVLPKNQIHLVDGIMQLFTNFFAVYHVQWLAPVIAAMVIIGNLGGITVWIISPAKGLLQAAQSGFLPPFLTRENKHGVASNLLIVQAVIVSMICLAFLLMPSVNGSYWLLTALSTQLYILMYVILFIVALRLCKKQQTTATGFTIPGGKLGVFFVCTLGLMGCAMTLIVGFIPPEGINVGSFLRYEIVFIAGMITLILPVVLLYGYRKNLAQYRNS